MSHYLDIAQQAIPAAQHTSSEDVVDVFTVVSPTAVTQRPIAESSMDAGEARTSARLAAAQALQAAYASAQDAQIEPAWQVYLATTSRYCAWSDALRRQDPATARAMDAEHAARICAALAAVHP